MYQPIEPHEQKFSEKIILMIDILQQEFKVRKTPIRLTNNSHQEIQRKIFCKRNMFHSLAKYLQKLTQSKPQKQKFLKGYLRMDLLMDE